MDFTVSNGSFHLGNTLWRGLIRMPDFHCLVGTKHLIADHLSRPTLEVFLSICNYIVFK